LILFATISLGLAVAQTGRSQSLPQGGLPVPPAAAVVAPIQAPFAAVAPPADPEVASLLSQQAEEASRAEQVGIGGDAQ